MTDKKQLPVEGLYCITGEEFSRGRSNLQVVEEMIAAGVKLIQYREKEKPPRRQYVECLAIRRLTAAAGVVFIVNDDAALALAVAADGVHIGQDDLPLEKVRELVGEGMIIGVSTHSPAQLEAAVAGGADYLGVGPLYLTHTKKDVCAPVGLAYLDYAVQHCPIPFVAIGGIKEHNLAEVAGRGARLICAVTEILAAANIREKIFGLRAIIEKGGGSHSVPASGGAVFRTS